MPRRVTVVLGKHRRSLVRNLDCEKKQVCLRYSIIANSPILTYPYPRSEGLPFPLHHLRNMCIVLESKESLRTINKAILDPQFSIVLDQGGQFSQLWERKAWKEFEVMRAEEKRLLIEKVCNDKVERE